MSSRFSPGLLLLPLLLAASADASPLLHVKIGGKWGFADRSGALVIPAVYDEVAPFSDDGHAKVWQGRKAGLIDSEGKTVLEPIYDDLGPEASPAFPQQLHTYEEEDPKPRGAERLWAFIHSTAFREPHQSYFRSDRILIRRDGGYGYADRSGQEVIPPEFSDARNFRDGKAAVSGFDLKGNRLWWVIGPDGQPLTEKRPRRPAGSDPEFAEARRGSGAWWNYFDGEDYPGRVPGEHETAGFPAGQPRWEFRGEHGASPTWQADRWRLVGPGGEVLVKKVQEWKPFVDGLAAVQRKAQKPDGKNVRFGHYRFGYIDLQGGTAIPARFDFAGSFRDGAALVRLEGKVGWIDTEGNWVLVPRE